ncbi:MAG: hypothetical protein AABW87_00665, partial [Nanoarchaeota archaeon]
MRRVMLLFLVVIFSSLSAYAEGVNVTIDGIDDHVPAGGTAIYRVEIANNQLANDVFAVEGDDLSLYPFSDFAFDVKTDPGEIEVNRGEKGSLMLYVRTLSTAGADKTYELPLKIISKIDKDIEVKTSLLVRIQPASTLIEITPEIPDVIAPGRETEITLLFKNNGNVLLEDAEVYLSSPVFTDTRILTFKPDVEIEEKFEINLDTDTEPGKYPLTVRVYKDDEIKGVFTAEFEVAMTTDVGEKQDTYESFLKKRILITNENDGNFDAQRKIEYKTGGLAKLFIRIDPDAEYKNGRYVWEFSLKPKEVYKVEIVVDYLTPAIIVLFIIIALGVLYYFLTKDVRVKKKVFKIRHNLEDNITELKIMLHVKNKTAKQANNVKITELLPSYVLLSKEFGTLKPDHIQKGTSGGMRLIWEVGLLEVGEERVI